MRQIFLDTETTGLSADNGDRIIELGCVEMVARKLTGRHLHLYFNPERDSHEDALRVHGIANAFLLDKPKFAACVDDILRFVAGADIVIHNAAFDLSFLNHELHRAGQPSFQTAVASVTDSLAMAKEQFPGKRNSLDALCDRLEVDNSGRTLHGALLDAQLLAEVYIRMTRGQEALLGDGDDRHSTQTSAPRPAVALAAYDLRVLHANDQELAAHQTVLTEIDKASGGKTLWPH